MYAHVQDWKRHCALKKLGKKHLVHKHSTFALSDTFLLTQHQAKNLNEKAVRPS
jgi:hypothetical protein